MSTFTRLRRLTNTNELRKRWSEGATPVFDPELDWNATLTRDLIELTCLSVCWVDLVAILPPSLALIDVNLILPDILFDLSLELPLIDVTHLTADTSAC